MGDHFWPAVYPGLIVGLLYGLALGGIPATLAATIGGLIGAVCYGLLAEAIALPPGLPSLALLIGCALAGAVSLTRILAILKRHASRR